MTVAPSDASMQEPRIFIGVPVHASPSMRRLLSDLAGMGRAVRAVNEQHLHLTLKFYGNVASEVIQPLSMELDRISSDHPSFDWTIRGTGAFPSVGRPSVVWVGTEERRFLKIAERIEKISETLGFSRERRPFAPHVTVARIKFRPPPALKTLLHETADEVFGPQRTESLIIFQSELTPSGAVYTPLHYASLQST